MVANDGFGRKRGGGREWLASKGFSEAVVSLTQDGADAVVNARELSDANRAQIEDTLRERLELQRRNIVITICA